MNSFDSYFSSDLVVHFPDQDQNREMYKGLCQAYFSAFPDLTITTEQLTGEGDKVTKVWTANCTHKGEFMGIPASGKPLVVKGIELFRIEEGRLQSYGSAWTGWE